MMKRILCLVLCLMLALPAAFAETADTLPKRFVRQLTGGNGARGYISVSASGVAEWLNLLLPFTAAEIQVRAIGQKQGDMSETVDDDDDWQIRFYVKDSAGQETGTTWLYGNPEAMYFQSELLPDVRLRLPVSRVNLLYQIFKGEWNDLFFAFDPMDLKAPGPNGNASAYQAIAEVLGVPEQTWNDAWLPVLDKYFNSIDLWLADYGASSIVSEQAGSLTMVASYTIPAEALKAEAKLLLGQMLYDNELMNLLLPHVSTEQQITYLNPQMYYFYEACIDSLPLRGNIVLSREMSAMGEVVSTTMELPLPPLPDELTAAADKAVKAMLHLSDEANLFAGVERLVMHQAGQERAIALIGPERTLALTTQTTQNEEGTAVAGTLSVTPVQGSAVTAAFDYAVSHRVWQDEKYLDHDTTRFTLSVKSAADAEAQPMELIWTLDYRNNPAQQDSPVQVNLNADVKLPDAEVTVEAVLRITTQMAMEALPTTGMEDASKLTEERKAALLQQFVLNMANTISAMNGEADNTAPSTPDLPAAEPTAVPPMAE